MIRDARSYCLTKRAIERTFNRKNGCLKRQKMLAQEFSSQPSPAEKGSAHSFSRSQKVGQAPNGQRMLSNKQTVSSASLKSSSPRHSTNITNCLWWNMFPKESAGPHERAGYPREISYKDFKFWAISALIFQCNYHNIFIGKDDMVNYILRKFRND